MTESGLHLLEFDLSQVRPVVVEDKEAARVSEHDVVGVNVGVEVVVVLLLLWENIDIAQISKWLHDNTESFISFSFGASI